MSRIPVCDMSDAAIDAAAEREREELFPYEPMVWEQAESSAPLRSLTGGD